jgi:hypothetical protein
MIEAGLAIHEALFNVDEMQKTNKQRAMTA